MALGTGAAAAQAVDINCADAATLAAGLQGVGEAKAQAIVAYREQQGPFKSADELANVKGIGAKTVEANRANITASESCQPAAAPNP
nr:ComEA family DNA-binding protein [Immundisolibacter sp.]